MILIGQRVIFGGVEMGDEGPLSGEKRAGVALFLAVFLIHSVQDSAQFELEGVLQGQVGREEGGHEVITAKNVRTKGAEVDKRIGPEVIKVTRGRGRLGCSCGDQGVGLRLVWVWLSEGKTRQRRGTQRRRM